MIEKRLRSTTPASELVRQEIERHGPMRFDKFVELALYHPRHGYYNRSAPVRGRAGDYFTAPQVGGLMPAVVSDIVHEMRSTLETSHFHLVDIGAGDGELLDGVLRSLESENRLRGFHVWAVERSGPARERLWRRLSRYPKCRVVSSIEDIEVVGGVDGCIFSNEFFDALPFRRFRRTENGWDEIRVGLRDSDFAEEAGPVVDALASGRLASLSAVVAPGQEIERRFQIDDVWRDWRTVLARGFVLTFDYGGRRRSLLSPARQKGTWRCFQRHAVDDDVFRDIGRQDITADVDFSQIAETGARNGFKTAHFSSQGVFLAHAGHERFERFLRDAPESERRRRAGAVQQLVHPDAMGDAFSTLVQTRETELPPALAKIPNRANRL